MFSAKVAKILLRYIGSLQCEFRSCMNNSPCLRFPIDGAPLFTEKCICAPHFYGPSCEFDSSTFDIQTPSLSPVKQNERELVIPSIDDKIYEKTIETAKPISRKNRDNFERFPGVKRVIIQSRSEVQMKQRNVAFKPQQGEKYVFTGKAFFEKANDEDLDRKIKILM